MARTRSRPRTEARFQNAVLELLAEGGCSGLGVNSVAQRAGADKVLIYRYFGSLEGLLRRVVEGREWLPVPGQLVASVEGEKGAADSASVLKELCDRVGGHLHSDAVSRQALLWRRTGVNALTAGFTVVWLGFWEALAADLSNGLDSDARARWAEACRIASLVVEASVAGEAPVPGVFERLAGGLVRGTFVRPEALPFADVPAEERLPTNLL